MTQIRVLHGKFAAYLSPSQPFLHDLVTRLNEGINGVVLCNRRENVDQFPFRDTVQIRTAHLFAPHVALAAAARLRADYRPDLMHAHFGWSGIRLLMLKKFLDIPLVTTFGGRDAMSQIDAPHYKTLYAELLAASDRIVCVSAALADEMARRGVEQERIRLIRRGTDLRTFAYVDRQGRLPDQTIRLLMVGRLVEKKAHQIALQAFAELVKRGRNVHLMIAGDGPELQRLTAQRKRLGLEQRVEFVGHLERPAIRGLMARSDIFLHPSVTGMDGDSEGIPNVLVEASATGLPAVATRHGGIAEVVKPGETGLLVEEGDIGGLVNSLDLLVESPVMRLVMGKAANARAAVHCDLADQVAQHQALYSELVEGKARRRARPRQPVISVSFRSAASALYRKIEDRSLAELGRQLIGNPFLVLQSGGLPSAMPPWISRISPFVPASLKLPIKRALVPCLIRLVDRKRRRMMVKLEQLGELDDRVLSDLESNQAVAISSKQWSVLEQLSRRTTEHGNRDSTWSLRSDS